MNFKGSNVSYVGGSAVPSFSSVPYSPPKASKTTAENEKTAGCKSPDCYAGCPCFLNTFSCISEKLMPPAKADFTKTNGFKAFSGFWQENTLIQPQYSADSRLFRAKQGGYPNPMPTSDSIPTSFSPVTHRDGLCAGFKTQFGRCTMKQVFWLVEPMWSRGISPQINQYD